MHFTTYSHHPFPTKALMIFSTFTFGLSLVASALAGPMEQVAWSSPHTTDVKVPVTLGVMSRCPDALLCESVFNQVLTKVEGKVDLALTYVGRCARSRLPIGARSQARLLPIG